MRTDKGIYLFIAVLIGFFGMASVAQACAADEWCCKRDFSAPGNPCIKCCPKNQPGPDSLTNRTESGSDAGAKLQACQKPLQSSDEPVLLSKAELPGSGKSIADETIRHGTWHPCADDPDACGSGHVCCSGHCIFGSTCGGN